MRYFIDTEFIERGPYHPIELISIGIVREDNKSYYAVSSEFDGKNANEWVRQNVFPHIRDETEHSLKVIADGIKEFIGDDKQVRFWGYFADYDWVVFCQIFGSMIDFPEGWPMYCNDLKQWCVMLGDPKLPEQQSKEHNALNDAIWNKEVFEFLTKYQRRGGWK